ISSKPAAGPAQTAAQAPAAPQSGMSRWMGPIAGIAAGLGIAALFSHFGMGAGMGNMVVILLLVAAAVFAVRWLMRRRQPANGMQSAMQYAGPAGGMPQQGGFTPATFGGGVGAAASGTASAANVPADFDVEGFLRQSKLSFIRLQAANDRGDMEDIRLFCSPELAAEVQMQYQERNRQAQQTDVVQLNAELLDVSVEAGRMLASVRFSGQIREEAGAPAEAFSEVWHLTSGLGAGQTWHIAGIQQD
ncbi:MAG: Tim44-like domain-containing protein, partial [Humidesulfovibrio sp.]|nr:Tim44-like domain-containing protein [Humidesulfovibrio sp.]